MDFTFKLRRDIAADWTTANPILMEGEPGVEIDTNKFKIGDGIHYWNDLDYFIDQDAIEQLIADLAVPGGPHTHTESQVTNLVADLAAKASTTALNAHIANTSNPHSVSKTQVGLGNVDDTSDAAKPISDLTAIALGGKAATAHNHAATDVTSGTFAIGRIPTGTSGSTVSLGNHNHPVSPVVVVLTDGATIAIDATLGERFRVVLTGDHTLGNPSGAVDGQLLLIELIQDGSGGQAVTLGTKYNDPNGYYTGQSTAAGKRDKLGVQYNSSDDKFDVLAFAVGY